MSRPKGLRGRGLHDLGMNINLVDQMLAPFRVFWVDPANGSDQRTGRNLDEALASLPAAHDRCTAGLNDVVALVGDGGTAASARLTETLIWSKNATHLIGVAAPSYNPRARIATLSGAAAFANFIRVTASGCRFQNFSIFNDNAIAAQITWDDRGGRNYYENVLFGGIGDVTSAASTTSRVLRLGGSGASGENWFKHCTIGIDTIGRSVANASLEFIGTNPSKRNVFEDCLFTIKASATTALTILSSGVNPLESFQLFKNCTFHNSYPQYSALLQAAVATLAANGNGRLVMDNCRRYGVTDWGTDSTSLAQIYVAGSVLGAGDDVGQSAAAIAS